MAVRWVWDAGKNRANKRNHGLSFETAQRVFQDPFALTRTDPHPDNDRWQTVGRVGHVTLFVVHTWPGPDDVGRIISARKATSHERRAYEEDGS